MSGMLSYRPKAEKKNEEETIMTEEILRAISSEVYGVWFLIGAALVFWMQAGFAMVETGFTRAKNAGKYPDEKPDGLLYRYSDVHLNRLFIPAW